MFPITTYKSKIASRYVPVDPEQIGMKIVESDYYLMSVKYDGHLGILAVKNGQAALYDRNGDVLAIPAILKAAEALKEDVILAGEICCFVDGKSTSHREVSSALADPVKHDIRFGVFDILEHKGEAVTVEPKVKHGMITSLSTSDALFAIEQKLVESRKDIMTFFKEVADTVEGLVVRASNGIVYKIKPSYTLDMVVLGYAESTGDREGWMRELLLGFCTGKNTYQIVTKCGGGFSEKDRQDMPKQLEKLAVQSEYTEVSGAKTAFIMVKPEWVVEISCLDLINEAGGAPIRKSLLKFDGKKGYSIEGNFNTLSLISPNFVRIRGDKKANEQDAGTAQAYALIAPAEEKKISWGLDESKVIMREVFVKAGKGGTAVRKFVGLRTNKEATGQYPPFLVVFTDYSGGRKIPLEQELFLCSSEKEVHAKIEALKEENIKKGWEVVK